MERPVLLVALVEPVSCFAAPTSGIGVRQELVHDLFCLGGHDEADAVLLPVKKFEEVAFKKREHPFLQVLLGPYHGLHLVKALLVPNRALH